MISNGNWSDWSVKFTETSSPSETKSNSFMSGAAPKPTASQSSSNDFLDAVPFIYFETTGPLKKLWRSVKSLLRRKANSSIGWYPKSDGDLFRESLGMAPTPTKQRRLFRLLSILRNRPFSHGLI